MGGERKGQNVKTSVCLYIKNCVFVRGEATGVTFSGQNGEKKTKNKTETNILIMLQLFDLGSVPVTCSITMESKRSCRTPR